MKSFMYLHLTTQAFEIVGSWHHISERWVREQRKYKENKDYVIGEWIMKNKRENYCPKDFPFLRQSQCLVPKW